MEDLVPFMNKSQYELEKNFIHPTAIVEQGVFLGENNYIGPFCFIQAGTVIGSGNRFEAYCSIGTPPEHKEFFTQTNFSVKIGNNNTFREFVTINSGTVKDTIVEDGVTMLRGSHVGHDARIERNATLSCNVLIGGHSVVMQGANMGLGSICHQFSIIGAYSMVGMGTVITKKTPILPGNVYIGSPATFLKKNTIGIQRSLLSAEQLTQEMLRYETISSLS
jgi:UDP-N-acetylglucosamine acyltransferase